MLIEKKLLLTRQPNRACFIGNGLFCNLYEQSAYIVCELLGVDLKLRVETIKKLNNEKLIVTGFPNAKVLGKFPEAIKTQWGYVLQDKFDLQGFSAWKSELEARL
ncbi:hypothetical protein [Gilliamella apis]|uniref:Uncharacterized protein n=1 Tax=Gilliamella apis TaxID=1970738 RepID=A0A242NRA1_9GAMM|nr:hypothetical protein [Gilliamella apis]OTQ37037.1 hypothetical protein B6C84_00100 [Gilliamella apis]OTQ38278.1 hypothetical protein B6C88_01290 [Gilliamella apis]OTQ41236.1 hypothetical protein B6D26_03245 [Gilliamella apis]OTQ43972.1 hypothetical protein B6C94_00100 [Gilliamella apis]OTQ47594.1 hypothetical protein B6C86_00100 [Gilliamella apis]